MIPLRSTERVWSPTPITVALLATNVALFLFQATLAPWTLERFVEVWGVVPAALHPLSLVTSMFLHGGWLHLGGNMLFLWVFGRNLEDRLGGPRYLAFYLLNGVIAAGAQILTNPNSQTPMIGASGAIAGVMGAYLIKFPRARIITLIPLLVFFTTIEIPAVLLLLYWFVIQLFSSLTGFGSLEGRYGDGGVAWFAHVGGFIAGMLLVGRFPERPRRRVWWDDEPGT